jgi:cytoskeletal protein CcmA (bactofilin family)
MIFKSEGSTTDLNGFLDAGSHVEGDLRFENTFRIDGRLTGRIVSDGTLIVGEGGQLKGEVTAGQIFVSGRVEGQITARQKVQIETTGKVLADIETPTLIIVDGALFEGRCTMAGRGSSEKGQQAGPKPLAQAVSFSKDR